MGTLGSLSTRRVGRQAMHLEYHVEPQDYRPRNFVCLETRDQEVRLVERKHIVIRGEFSCVIQGQEWVCLPP